MIKALSRLNPRRGLPEVRLLCLIKSCQKRQTDELDDMDLATAFMDERHAMTLLRSISRTSREKRLWQEMLNHSDAAISAFIDQEDEADHIAAVDYLTERLKQDFRTLVRSSELRIID